MLLREGRDLPVWGLPWQSNPWVRLVLGQQVSVACWCVHVVYVVMRLTRSMCIVCCVYVLCV